MTMAEIRVPIQVNLPDDWVEQIVNRLRNDPEAEWVEVTRCKDCKYAHITYRGEVKYCDIWFPDESHYIDTDNYCSFAERREE